MYIANVLYAIILLQIVNSIRGIGRYILRGWSAPLWIELAIYGLIVISKNGIIWEYSCSPRQLWIIYKEDFILFMGCGGGVF